MSEHSITEAEAHLSDLIDRALAGEGIVITREGRPAVELRPLSEKKGRPVTADDLAWIARRRAGSRMPNQTAGELVSEMRDDEQRDRLPRRKRSGSLADD